MARLGQTVTTFVSVYDGDTLTDPDTDTLEIFVYDDEGTQIDVETEGLVSWTAVSTGRFHVALDLDPAFFERGRVYSAEITCEIDATALSTPAADLASFAIDDTIERLEHRHGQGPWGPGYDRTNLLGDPTGIPSTFTIPFGTWETQFLFDDADLAAQEFAASPFAGNLTVNGAEPTDGGLLGPADLSICFPDGPGIDDLNADTDDAFGDISTGDIGVAIAFHHAGPYITKQAGGGGAGWGVFVNGGSDTALFSLADGSTYMNASPLPGLSLTPLGTSLDRGAILIAALARGTDKARVGIMTRDGQVTMSALVDASALGSLTNTGIFKISHYDADGSISQLAFGTDMAGVPENLETCLRAYHARVFGSIPQLEDIETKVDTVDGVVDAINAKTTNLPSDPADQSLIIAATDALVTLIGTVDNVVDAIKAKTDQLAFTVANRVDATATVSSLGTDAISAASISTAAVNKIRDGLLSYTLYTGRTVVGYLRRANASLERAAGLKGTTAQFLTQAGAVIWSITQSVTNGTRGTIDLGDTEDPP